MSDLHPRDLESARLLAELLGLAGKDLYITPSCYNGTEIWFDHHCLTLVENDFVYAKAKDITGLPGTWIDQGDYCFLHLR